MTTSIFLKENTQEKTKKKRDLFSSEYFEKELKNSKSINSNFFCKSKNSSYMNEEEKYIECSKCLRDFCETCFENCHKGINCKEVGTIDNYFVFEYASSCHCDHLENRSNSENHLICFYTKFLIDNYCFKNVNNESHLTFECCFGRSINNNIFNILQRRTSSHSFSKSRKCQDTRLNNPHLLEFLKLFNLAYRANNNKISYKEIKEKLKNELSSHLNDIADDDKKKLINYHIKIFIIHNIMFNVNFEITFEEEFNFFNSIVNIIQYSNDYQLFFKEKINMPLTYVFYFYRKYLFSNLEMITIIKINSFDYRRRLEIMNKNINYINEIKWLFSSEKDRHIVDFLLRLKTFSIKLSSSEKNIPFTVYFLNMLFESYSIEDDQIDKFLKRLSMIKYKKDHHKYNIYLRRFIDEILYISQIYRIDIMINNKSITCFDDKLIKYLYFSNSQENKNKIVFTEYFNKMFSKENILFLESSLNENYNVTKELKKDPLWVSIRTYENLYYFNCFHNKFISKSFDKNYQNSLLSVPAKISSKKRESPNEPHSTKKFLLFKNMTIEWFIDYDQNQKIDELIKKILNEQGLPSESNCSNECLDFLFLVIKKYQKEIKNNDFFQIDVSSFFEKKIINISQINLRGYKEELKFILYKIFCLEYYKDAKFSEILNNWNLLLFCFLCNVNNALFIFNEVKFLDFLLYSETKEDINTNEKIKQKTKISFLEYSIANGAKNWKEEMNYTWRFFYISYCCFIDKLEELEFLKENVLKNFVNKLLNFSIIYENGETKKKDSENIIKLNYPLVFYFLKITKKILIESNVDSFLPYNFNSNKFEFLEKIKTIANIIFKKEFDFSNYFSNFYELEITETIQKSNDSNEVHRIKNKEKNGKQTNFMLIKKRPINEIINNDNKIKIQVRKIYLREKIDSESIKVLILEFLGGFNTTTDFHNYFKILNENIPFFEEFFQDKKKHIKNDLENSKKEIFDLELLILRFMLNFITIKFYDHSKIEVVSHTNITDKEYKNFEKDIRDFKKNFDIKRKMIGNTIESKYMISKMKIEIMKKLNQYLGKFDENFYESNETKLLILFILKNLSLILKEFDLISDKESFIEELQFEFIKVLESLFDFVLKSKIFDILIPVEVQNIDLNKIRYDSKKHFRYFLYEKTIQKIFNELIGQEDIEALNKINPQIFGNISKMIEYFENFEEFDRRKYSNHSILIKDFLSFQKYQNSEIIIKHIVWLYDYDKNHFELNEETNQLKRGIFDNIQDDSVKSKMKKFVKISKNHKKLKDNKDKLSIEIWRDLNEGFSSYDRENFDNLLEYLFTYIKINQKSNRNFWFHAYFDSMFSENLLKIINFFNNILYYYPLNFQQNLVEKVTKDSMIFLMKNMIKLNNYIIGISEYESDGKQMSLSKIYFIIMDFFILLGEGLDSSKFNHYFFLELNEDSEDDLVYSQNEETINQEINLKNLYSTNIERDIYNRNNLKWLENEIDLAMIPEQEIKKHKKNSSTLEDLMKNPNKKPNFVSNHGYNSNVDLDKINQDTDKLKDYNDNNYLPIAEIFRRSNIDIDQQLWRKVVNSNKESYIIRTSKMEIGIDNVVIEDDQTNLKDSGDFFINYENLKNELENTKKIFDNEDKNNFDFKDNLNNIIEKFLSLKDFEKTISSEMNSMNKEEIDQNFKEFQNLFTLTKLIFENLKEIYNVTENISILSLNGIQCELEPYQSCNKNEPECELDQNESFIKVKNLIKIIDDLNYILDDFEKKKDLYEIPNEIEYIHPKIIDEIVEVSESTLKIIIKVFEEIKTNNIDDTQSHLSKIEECIDEHTDLIEGINKELKYILKLSSNYEKNEFWNINQEDNFIKTFKEKNELLKPDKNNGSTKEYQAKNNSIDNNNIKFKNFQVENMRDRGIIDAKNDNPILMDLNENKPSIKKFRTIDNSNYHSVKRDYKIDPYDAAYRALLQNKEKSQPIIKTTKENVNHNVRKEDDPQKYSQEQESKVEKKINQGNFYYFSFVQLKNIINLINKTYSKYFWDGSYRLILQFLYISRFLREYIEIEEKKENEWQSKIIEDCFIEIFDPRWITSDYIKNEDFSYIIRYQLVNLLFEYIDENAKSSEKIIKKFIEKSIDGHKIFKEIKECIRKIIEEKTLKSDSNKKDIYPKFEELTSNFLFKKYIEDENNIYKNKYFELAESYYKLIRIINPFHQSLEKKYVEQPYRKKKFFDFSLQIKNEKERMEEERKMIMNQNDPNFKIDRELYLFLLKIGKEIEVKFKTSSKEYKFKRIFFFKSPKCFWLNPVMLIKFLEKTPRANLNKKLDHLNKRFDKFLLKINASYYFRFKPPKLLAYIFRKSSLHKLDFINFIFILILNIQMLVYYYEDRDNSSKNDLMAQFFPFKNFSRNVQGFNYIFFTTFVFCFLQIWLLTIWFVFRYKVRRTLSFYKSVHNGKYFISNEKENKSFEEYMVMRDRFENFEDSDFNIKIVDFGSFISNIIIKFKILFWNRDIFYIVSSFIFNVLYLITEYELLLVIPILSIMNLYSLFNYFYRAMISKYKEFIALLIFIYIFEYIFSWISFLHYQDFMISEHLDRSGNLNENESQKELLCSTPIECFLNYVDLGLRLGGGMGDATGRLSFKYQDKRRYILKVLWDILFHIIINLILGNIFFGVIVDTFNDLRDKKDEKTEDEVNKCFMCQRDRFDNYQEDFEVHRNVQHHIFNYVFFIPYLLKKNPQEYSRAELYAWEQINLRKNDWLPSPVKKTSDEEDN